MPSTNYSPKAEALEKLKKELEEDISLPLREANLVFGEGNINTDVLFIGEAPGYQEDLEKRPFVGRSGQLLNKLIEGIKWKREDVYITNIVKRRPPNNRDPLPEEISAYEKYLMKQIEILNPKIIAPLGRFSMNFFLPTAKISRDQGKIFWWNDKLILPLYHPAAALRQVQVMDDLKKSFVKIPVIVKKYDEFLKARVEKIIPHEPNVEKKAAKQMKLF
ncbi:MAG: uracil-DNA glycosylase [Candidatus Colwellbacteria bacterium]|nr:uracil-DNA glycosylase [Candidatus Colwellbacteria bacterium]